MTCLFCSLSLKLYSKSTIEQFPVTTHLTPTYTTFYLSSLVKLDPKLHELDESRVCSAITEVCSRCYEVIKKRCKKAREIIPMTKMEVEQIRILKSHNMQTSLKKKRQEQFFVEEEDVEEKDALTPTKKLKVEDDSGILFICFNFLFSFLFLIV
jgi:hypothetical protein